MFCFRCLDLDPKDLDSLMLLAISYTNEAMQSQACDTLIRWLHTNPKYTHLVDSSLLEDTSTVTSILCRFDFFFFFKFGLVAFFIYLPVI